MEMIFQRTFVIAGNNVQYQPASVHHILIQGVKRLLQQILPIGTYLVPPSAFKYTQHVNAGIAGVKILPDAGFKLLYQLPGLILPFLLFVTIFKKIYKIAQLFQRIFILHNLPGKHIQLEDIQPLHRIIDSINLFNQYFIDFLLILLDLHLHLFPELSQIERIHIFQNQTQVQLRIGRRAQFLGVDFIQRIDDAVVETEYQ